MSRVLVTGANGQLGLSIKSIETTFPELDIVYTDVDELDITSLESIQANVEGLNPKYIINCAAYTAVDKAEQEPELASKLNATAPELLSKVAREHNAKLVHISTDYVFDGKTYQPYSENSPVSPASIYGSTKQQGEENALSSGVAMVIRTSWLYSVYGNNFIKTIASKGKTQPELNVVFDQIGSPTWAHDLAQAILTIVNEGESEFSPEIFHFSNEGVCSWYDVAKIIARHYSYDCKINAILSSQYPTPAPRPHYSVLSKAKIKGRYSVEVPHWHSSLLQCLEKMKTNNI